MPRLALAARAATLPVLLALSLAAPLQPPPLARAFSSAEHVVVVRVGDGATPLSSAAASVSLLEFSGAGALVSTLSLPTADAGAHQALTLSGTAASEGALSRSPDGHLLALAGYDAPPGTPNVGGTTGSAVNRVVGLVRASGTVSTSTTLSAFSGGSVRGAATADGVSFWVAGATAGGSGGLRHVAGGSAGAAGTQITTDPTNIRAVRIYGGGLHISSASGSFHGLSRVGAGLPAAGGQPSALLAGAATAGPSPSEFVLLDTDLNGSLDRAYVADDRAAPNGGVQRWDLSGSAWGLAYTITSAGGLRGLAALVTGPGAVTLYGTTTATSNNALVRVVDAGAASPATTVATAGPNFAFRGVAMAPVVTPTPVTLSALSAGPGPSGGVELRWAAETEYDLVGYHVLRSATGRRADAARATEAPIPTAGDGIAGAVYTWADPAGGPGVSYWLQALNRDGSVTEHGPVSLGPPAAAGGPRRVFLALVRR